MARVRWTCPVPEIARLGKTVRQWHTEFLGYFDTGGASNGDNYRLRMLLIRGGLNL